MAGKHFVLPSPLYLNWTWWHQASSFVREWSNNQREALGHPASIRSQQENNWSCHIILDAEEKLGTSFKDKRNQFCTGNFLSSKVKQKYEEYELCCVQQVLPLNSSTGMASQRKMWIHVAYTGSVAFAVPRNTNI